VGQDSVVKTALQVAAWGKFHGRASEPRPVAQFFLRATARSGLKPLHGKCSHGTYTRRVTRHKALGPISLSGSQRAVGRPVESSIVLDVQIGGDFGRWGVGWGGGAKHALGGSRGARATGRAAPNGRGGRG